MPVQAEGVGSSETAGERDGRDPGDRVSVGLTEVNQREQGWRGGPSLSD